MIKKFSRYNPNKISAKDVENELAKSKEEIARQNQRVCYFHGDIDRNVAEKLLKDFYYNNGECKSNHTTNSLDGLFLVRKCSASADDFSLSLINKGQFYHYRINHSIDAYYVLDDGPLIHGLDELIKHYQLDPHGLPCRLNVRFVPRGGVLPSKARVVGNTNPLHLTVACVSESNKLKLILRSPNRPDINEKDDNGRTALHIACEYDNINAVEELIEANALANIRAKDGSTPLHTAAEFGSIQCLEYLLKSGKVNPMERNMTNNWVALHEAAYRDHFTCVNALLNYGLPDKPRTCDNQTPLDLAIENGHKRTISVLRGYMSPEPRLRHGDFLHDASVTREVALKLLESSSSNKSSGGSGGENANNGFYLVRRTQRDENIMVLSLIYNGEFFNYEICVKDLTSNINQQQQQRFYFIDDGPYFRSLPHLIEHYTKYEDGLPGILTRPIHPSSSLNGSLTSASKQQLQQQQQVKPHHQFSSSTTSSNSSVNSGPLNHIQPNVVCNMMNMMNFSNMNGNNNSSASCNNSNQSTPQVAQNSKSDALLRANLFKSRTLLNDQKRKSKASTSKKLEKISISEIQIQSTIGEGEFGTVYKAIYNGKQVAIKALKDCTASSDFMREADIMGTLNHPCILKIFGLVQDTEYLMMVQELMICSILEKLWQAPHEITEHHLKIWSSQIALGMQHMEEQKIVHRDLAARNVLLASMYQIKISDFGLSRSTDAFTNAYTQKTEGKIPIKWYSPESIELLKFTSKSDVWSYGITLWELFSYGDQPYGNKSGSEVYMFIQSGQRLERPPSCPPNTYKTMLQCWEWQEEKRPTFRELNQMFQNDTDYQKTLPILKSFR